MSDPRGARAAVLLIVLLAGSSCALAQKADRVRFAGDPLAEEEKRILARAVPASFAGTLFVRKGDLDGDGQTDLVVFAPDYQVTVFLHFLERGKPPERRAGGLRLRRPVVPTDEPVLIPGRLPGHNDILIRTRSGCGVVGLHGAGLESERLDCAWSNREYLVRRAECQVSGGDWKPGGRLGYAGCQRATADAGKACVDSGECESECVYAGPLPPPTFGVKGACSATTAKRVCAPVVSKGEVLSWCIE
jgi:hypothetical protein